MGELEIIGGLGALGAGLGAGLAMALKLLPGKLGARTIVPEIQAVAHAIEDHDRNETTLIGVLQKASDRHDQAAEMRARDAVAQRKEITDRLHETAVILAGLVEAVRRLNGAPH